MKLKNYIPKSIIVENNISPRYYDQKLIEQLYDAIDAFAKSLLVGDFDFDDVSDSIHVEVNRTLLKYKNKRTVAPNNKQQAHGDNWKGY